MADGDADRALSETLERFGLDSLVSQRNLCRNTLRDKLPESPRETALLVTALEAGVPTRLRIESRISDVETVGAQLANQLEHSYGLSPASARWAVQTWASALDLSKPATQPAPTAGTGAQPPEGATVMRTPVDEVTTPPTGDVTATPSPSGEATAVPTPTPAAAGAPTSPGDLRGPGSFVGEGTVLRSAATAAGAGTAPPTVPTSPSPTPPKPGGRRNRRRLLIVGVIVLVGAVVGVVVALSRGNGKSPQAGGAHSVSQSKTAGGSGSTTSASTRAKAPKPTFAAISPVLAHRGDHEGYPQETIPAFVQAAKRGFTVETDIRWTKDDVAIITHDPRTGLGMVCSGGPYTVATTNWTTLQSSCSTPPSLSTTNQPYGIPTFDETVQQLSKIAGATVFAEIKVKQTQQQNEQFLAILRKYDMLSRTVVTSFYSDYLESFDKVVTEHHELVRTLRFASSNQPTSLADLQHIKAWGVIFVDHWDTIASLMTSAHNADIQVGIATTVSPPAPGDGPTQWAQAKSMGADFVLTDHPLAYHAWLGQH